MVNSRLGDGFILGAAFGAAAFFLLGTKKGNRILKALSEEGVDELNNFIKDLEKSRAGATPEPKTPVKKSNPVEEKGVIEEEVEVSSEVKPAKPRKFFKKSK